MKVLFLLFLLPVFAFAQPGETLRVDFIDVGQADCILIRQGGEAMLVDAGNNADRSVVESYLQTQGVAKLDYVVATHAHEDHIGSMDSIVSDFLVGKVWFPHQVTTTATYRSFVLAVKGKGLTFSTPKPGVTFMLGSAKATFVWPNDGAPESDLNEGSAVFRLDFGETSFLFTGDAGKPSEASMLQGSIPLAATVLKVGHHGSSGATSAAFLKAVHPQAAVISVGTGNTYGHPAKSTVELLVRAGIAVYRTDMLGTISAVSDGHSVHFTPTSPSPNH